MIILLFLLNMVTFTFKDTITVSDSSTLQTALNHPADSTLIKLTANIAGCNFQCPISADTVNMIGIDLNGYTIDGNLHGRVINLTTTTNIIRNNFLVKNGTIREGTAYDGGGLCLRGTGGSFKGSFVTRRMKWIANIASHCGAAILIEYCADADFDSIFIENSLFDSCVCNEAIIRTYDGVTADRAFITNITMVHCGTNYLVETATGKVYNSILWYNTYSTMSYTTTFNYSDYPGGSGTNKQYVPLFVDSLSNFKLQATSPLIDSGTNVSALLLENTDIDGNAWVIPYDIGCYEYGIPILQYSYPLITEDYLNSRIGINDTIPGEALDINGNCKADTFKGYFKGKADSSIYTILADTSKKLRPQKLDSCTVSDTTKKKVASALLSDTAIKVRGDSVLASGRVGGLTASQFLRSDVADTGSGHILINNYLNTVVVKDTNSSLIGLGTQIKNATTNDVSTVGVSSVVDSAGYGTHYGGYFQSWMGKRNGDAKGIHSTCTNWGTGETQLGHFCGDAFGGGLLMGINLSPRGHGAGHTYGINTPSGIYNTGSGNACGIDITIQDSSGTYGTGSHKGMNLLSKHNTNSDNITYGAYVSAQNLGAGNTFGLYSIMPSTGRGARTAIYGYANTMDTVGTVGDCIGVEGYALPSTNATNNVYGGKFSNFSRGTVGTHYGVYGSGAGGATAIGVYGTAAGGAVNWAGYFAGNVGVTDNLIVSREFIANEYGYDEDSRIEGLNDDTLFFVDASTDKVGIGKNNPSEKLEVDGNIKCDTLKGAVIGNITGTAGNANTLQTKDTTWIKGLKAGTCILADTAIKVRGDSVLASGRVGGLTAGQFLRSDVADTGTYIKLDSVTVARLITSGTIDGSGHSALVNTSGNLIINSGLDVWSSSTIPYNWQSASTSNWNTGTNVNQEATIIYSAPNSAKLGDGTNTGKGMAQSSAFRVIPSEEYMFSAKIAGGDATAKCIVIFKPLQSDGVTEITTDNSLGAGWTYSASYGGFQFTFTPGTTSFVTTSRKITLASNVYYLRLCMEYYTGGVTSKYVYVDNVQINYGSLVSAFAYKPIYDIGNQIIGNDLTVKDVIRSNGLIIDSPTVFVDTTNHRVGIGNIAPDSTLTVTGAGHFTTNLKVDGNIAVSGFNVGSAYTRGNFKFGANQTCDTVTITGVDTNTVYSVDWKHNLVGSPITWPSQILHYGITNGLVIKIVAADTTLARLYGVDWMAQK